MAIERLGCLAARKAARARREPLIEAIDAAINLWCGRDMSWGTSDCALAIADIYRQALGQDLAASWRGRYRTERGARRVLGRGGLLRAVAMSCRNAGWRRVKPAEVLPGDLAVMRTVSGPATAIRHREYWVGPREYGFAAYPANALIAAWSIG